MLALNKARQSTQLSPTTARSSWLAPRDMKRPTSRCPRWKRRCTVQQRLEGSKRILDLCHRCGRHIHTDAREGGLDGARDRRVSWSSTTAGPGRMVGQASLSWIDSSAHWEANNEPLYCWYRHRQVVVKLATRHASCTTRTVGGSFLVALGPDRPISSLVLPAAEWLHLPQGARR